MTDGRQPAWPPGDGEMAARIRAFDWARTPLGRSEGWPAPLRAAVQMMLAAPQIASLAVGPERLFLYNDLAAGHYGARHPHALGRPLPEVFAHEFDRVAGAYDRVFSGESLHVPAQPLDPAQSGQVEVFDAYLSPVRDAEGAVIAAYMTGVAAGERGRVEAALREREADLARVQRIGEVGGLEVDIANGLSSRRSPEYRRLHGLADDVEQETHAQWLARVHPEDRGAAEAALFRALEGSGSSYDSEYRIVRASDGAVRCIHARADIERDGQGRALRLIGAHVDVTEQKALQEALREGEELKAFLLRLSDALRPLTEASDIERTAVRLLGEQLGASRTIYATIADDGETWSVRHDHVAGVSSGVGVHPMTAYQRRRLPQWQAGRMSCVADSEIEPGFDDIDREAYRAFDARASIGVPLVRGGRFAALLAVNQTEPRAWTEAELMMARETAERTWAALERARAEAALRESEERQAFLLALSDALRPLTHALEIQDTATRLLGEHLGVRAVNYGLVEAVDGLEYYVIDRAYVAPGRRSTLGRWPVTDFPGFTVAMRAGETMAVDDVASAANLSSRDKAGLALTDTPAFLMAPLVKNERPTAMLCVVEDKPRKWTSAEKALVQEVAERTWAAVERARAEAALRDSEERLRDFGEASQDILWIRDVETLQWTYLTPAFETIYGLSREQALTGDNYRNWLQMILPADRETAKACIERVRSGEHVVFEYRIRRPADGEIRWLRNTDFPLRDSSGAVTLIGGIGHDMTEMRGTEERLKVLMEGIPQLVWRAVDGGEWTWASPQWSEYTGQPEEQSHDWGWLETIHEDDRSAARMAWADAEERRELDVEYRLRHAKDGAYRWFHTRASPVLDDRGEVAEWLGTSTDVQDLRGLQERQRVLLHELQHRVRNTLAVVRSLATSTGESSRTVEDYASHLEGRLSALARTQMVLTRSPGDGVDLESMVREELLAQTARDSQIEVEGSEVRLSAKAAEVLTLAVHELATNAVKYGALTAPQGRVSVRWTTEKRNGDDWLQLTWEERGVRVAATAPRHEGFGTELIEMRVPYELRGRGELSFRPGGVRCEIAFPLRPGESILQTTEPEADSSGGA